MAPRDVYIWYTGYPALAGSYIAKQFFLMEFIMKLSPTTWKRAHTFIWSSDDGLRSDVPTTMTFTVQGTAVHTMHTRKVVKLKIERKKKEIKRQETDCSSKRWHRCTSKS
jgi:hypothetical protein